MRRHIILFTQGYLGELLVKAAAGKGVTPIVYTYSRSATRRNADVYYMREGGQYRYINERSFDPEKVTVMDGDVIVCADWTKDFFLNSTPNAPVYYIHESLLPLYRGYGAVSEQFLRGVSVGGVSMYRFNGHIDAGPLAFQEKIRIEFHHTVSDYLKRCAAVAAGFIEKLANGFNPQLIDQDELKAFYLQRKRRNQGQIDLNMGALYVYNTIRAYGKPYFGAYFCHKGKKVTVWEAACEKWSGVQGEPGEVINRTPDGVEIACGEGSVILKNVEIDGTSYKFDNIALS